jgi:hypothetical protein
MQEVDPEAFLLLILIAILLGVICRTTLKTEETLSSILQLIVEDNETVATNICHDH